ncbi:hypothetical protein SEA_BECKERTON_54 [Mycobacterium phage Beckerton]|nr:hypothetical protein SEA_BECKERTON_54 [Mycobacterium phage Beckerton]
MTGRHRGSSPRHARRFPRNRTEKSTETDRKMKEWKYIPASEVVTGDITRRGRVAATITGSSPKTRILAFEGGAREMTISDHAPVEVLR